MAEKNIKFLKNTRGGLNDDVFCDGYVYVQKTNLKTAGKKSCCFRCVNKTKCHGTISFVTSIIDGENSAKMHRWMISEWHRGDSCDCGDKHG